MAYFTLAQAQLLGLDDLQSGIAETISTVAPLLTQIPFDQVSGNAFSFNRELTLVDGQMIAADGTITDSSALTNSLVTVNLTGISGQSDINKMHLAQAIGQNGGNDLRAIHVASAAKGVARKYLDWMVNGTVGANGFDGLAATVAGFAAQVEDAADAAFSFDLVDAALSRCLIKPTWIMGNAKAENAFRKAMRSAGGVTMMELNGVQFMSYEGIAFMRNDYISSDIDGVTAGAQTNIYFGSWDDGSHTGGVSGLTTFGDVFQRDTIAALEGKNVERERVVMYGALAVYSPLAVSVLASVTV